MLDYKLIHFHIFKNGGTTFDSILKANFGDFFCEFHGPNSNSSLFESDILDFIASFPHIKAVSSHHFRFPLNTNLNSTIKLFPVAFIRHPIDRIYSVYAHKERNVGNYRDKQNFKSWLEYVLDKEPHLVRDMQTNFFADGGTYYEVPDMHTFERAKSFLTDIEFCGVVDEYNLSMIVLEDLLSKRNLHIDAAYQMQNIAPDRHHDLSTRLAEINEQLGGALYDQLINNNLYDLNLYEYAIEKLLAQTRIIEDVDIKIHTFDKRMFMPSID